MLTPWTKPQVKVTSSLYLGSAGLELMLRHISPNGGGVGVGVAVGLPGGVGVGVPVTGLVGVGVGVVLAGVVGVGDGVIVGVD